MKFEIFKFESVTSTNDVAINLINEKIENSLELTIDEIDFKGSVSTVNLISAHSKQKMKIQNISSNVSKTLSPGLKVHILFNPNAGNIFL